MLLRTVLFPWGSSLGSSRSPRSTGSLFCLSQSRALLWNFLEIPFLLLIPSLIPTNSRSPCWENNQLEQQLCLHSCNTLYRVLDLLQFLSNSTFVVQAWETPHHLSSVHSLQRSQPLSRSQRPDSRQLLHHILLRCLWRPCWEDGKKKNFAETSASEVELPKC